MAVDKRATRLGVLALVATILFGLVGTRLWFLQTVQAESLQSEVDVTKVRRVPLLPERGRIFDADGRILADNQRVLTVGVDWALINSSSKRAEIFRRLSGWVDVPVEDMEERYRNGNFDNFLPMPIASGVTERTAIAIRERSEDLPGVSIIEDSRRTYPYAPLASHIVGYMGAITRETVDRYENAGYSRNERVGQFGVELSMEQELHGTWGHVTYEVDNASRIVREIERVPAINGRDIQLTIDLDQQQFAEQALETQLKLRRQATATNPLDKDNGFKTLVFPEFPREVPFKAPAGAVVMQNYETGHIAALATYPTFDNRWFESGLSNDKFQQLFDVTDDEGKVDPDKSILVNRAIQGRYNLGSTFKPFTAYAAMTSGLMTTGETYVDEGTYTMTSVDKDKCASGLVRCTYKNATCPNGLPCVYGRVDIEQALAISSDTFFYRIGEQIMEQNTEKDLLQQAVRSFGFGADTGIALPFEFDGTVPDRELKEFYASEGIISRDEGRGYFTGDNVQLAIGQGLLSASPLHLATGYSTIANSGFVMKPEIIKAIYHAGVPDDARPGYADLSQARLAEEPNVDGEVVRQIPMPADIRGELVRGLEGVIDGPIINGRTPTGLKLFRTYPDDAIPVAGKTGTAQGSNNYPWTDSSAFAAFSTDENNPYTITAYLEKSGYGAVAAGPVVKCMFMQISGDAPTDPVVLADQLDTDAVFAAPPKQLADTGCFFRSPI